MFKPGWLVICVCMCVRACNFPFNYDEDTSVDQYIHRKEARMTKSQLVTSTAPSRQGTGDAGILSGW